MKPSQIEYTINLFHHLLTTADLFELDNITLLVEVTYKITDILFYNLLTKEQSLLVIPLLIECCNFFISFGYKRSAPNIVKSFQFTKTVIINSRDFSDFYDYRGYKLE